MHAPKGWIRAPVNTFGEVSAGRQRSPNFIQGKPRPYLRVANVFESYIDTSDVNEMPFTDAEFERYKLEIGDILLNEGQSTELVGRPAMYEGIPANCCFQNTLVRFKANDSVSPYYALQRFLLCLYDGTFQSISKKTTSIAHLGVSRFADLVLAWPPLEEQQKIAETLSTWDKAVEKLEALIAVKQKRKKALKQKLLTGKKRLPGFVGEWIVCHLGELFIERNETGYLDLNLLSITREKGVIPRHEVERKDTSNDDKTKYLRICPGDIGYNTMRMWQGVSALSALEGIISPAYTVCTPTSKIDGNFAAYLFKTTPIVHLFQRYSQGLTSDTWNLKFRHFSEIRVLIPKDIEEQRKIASVLSAADQEIETHQKQLKALKEQKKGLMQQLLTGNKRVIVEPEKKAATGG